MTSTSDCANNKYTCECGSVLLLSGKTRHNKTHKHQDYLVKEDNPNRGLTRGVTRGLLISKEWVDEIFNKDDPKTAEIRTMSCITGRTYIIQTKGGGIIGECNITKCIKTTKNDLEDYNHKIPEDRIKEYVKGKTVYVWALSNIIKYENPIEYKVPKGCVICRYGVKKTYRN